MGADSSPAPGRVRRTAHHKGQKGSDSIQVSPGIQTLVRTVLLRRGESPDGPALSLLRAALISSLTEIDDFQCSLTDHQIVGLQIQMQDRGFSCGMQELYQLAELDSVTDRIRLPKDALFANQGIKRCSLEILFDQIEIVLIFLQVVYNRYGRMPQIF